MSGSNSTPSPVLRQIQKIYDEVLSKSSLRLDQCEVLTRYLEQELFDRISEHDTPETLPDLCLTDLAHASRLLIILASSAHETLQDPGKVEQLYTDLLTGTSRGLEEFNSLGKVLATLNEVAAVHGINALIGSSFDLPFPGQEVARLDPVKATVRLGSVGHLQSLQNLWCSVFCTLCSEQSQGRTDIETYVNPSAMKMNNLDLQAMVASATPVLASLCKYSKPNKLNLAGFSSLCRAISSLCLRKELDDSSRHIIVDGLISSLEVISDVPVDDLNEKNAQGTIRYVHKVLRRLDKAVYTVLFGGALRTRTSQLRSLAEAIAQVLRVCSSRITRDFAISKSTPDENAVEKHLRGMNAAVVSSCMKFLSYCVRVELDTLPPLALLLKCCFNPLALHSCVKLLCYSIKMDENMCKVLLTSLEEEGKTVGLSIAAATSGAKSSAAVVSSSRIAHINAETSKRNESSTRKRPRAVESPISPISPPISSSAGSRARYRGTCEVSPIVLDMIHSATYLSNLKRQLTWHSLCIATILFEVGCSARYQLKGYLENSESLCVTEIDSEYFWLYHELLKISNQQGKIAAAKSTGRLNMRTSSYLANQGGSESTHGSQHVWLSLLSAYRLVEVFSQPSQVIHKFWDTYKSLYQFFDDVVETGISRLSSSTNSFLSIPQRIQSASAHGILSEDQMMQRVLNGDLNSPLMCFVSFVSLSTSENSLMLKTAGRMIKDLPLKSQTLLLYYSSAHMKYILGNLWSSSKRLQNEDLRVNVSKRLISNCFELIIQIVENQKESIHAAFFEAVALCISTTMDVLMLLYPEDRAALLSCAESNVALRRAMDVLKDKSFSSLNPEEKLTVLHILRLSSRWSTSIQEADATSTARAHAAERAASDFALLLTKLWECLKPHIFSAVAKFDGNVSFEPREPSLRSPITGNLTGSEEKCLVDSDVAEKDDDASHRRFDDVSSIKFLTHVRSLAVAFFTCMRSASKQTSSERACCKRLLSIGQDIDGFCDGLLEKAESLSHSVSFQLTQLTTVCMLSSSFIIGVQSLSELSRADCLWGVEAQVKHGSRKRSSSEELQQTGMLGQLGAHILPKKDGNKRDTSFLEKDVLSSDGESQQGSTLVSILAHARLIKHSILINPHASIWALSQITYVWAHCSQDDGIVAKVIYGELSDLARQSLLQYLLVANVNKTIECVILPLLLCTSKKGTPNCQSWALKSLCSDLLCEGTDVLQQWEPGAAGSPRVSTNSRGWDQRDSFVKYAHAQIMTGLSLHHDKSTVASAKKLLSARPEIFFGLGDLGSLLDERPFILYRLLLSPAVQEEDDIENVIGQGFSALLNSCAAQLDIPLTFNAKGQTFNKTTTQNVLLPLVWDLGSLDFERKVRATRALQVLCTLIRTDSLKYSIKGAVSSTRGHRDSAVLTHLNDNVAKVLSENFLYIMANLLENHVVRNTAAKREADASIASFSLTQRVQCVRCLNSLVSMLRQVDLIRYLPKVMSILDRVLCDISSQVRYVGIELSSKLVDHLPHDMLCENLSTLVVGLFPSLLPDTDKWAGTLHNTESFEELQADDYRQSLNKFGSLPRLRIDRYVRDPTMHLADNKMNLSKDLSFILEASQSLQVSKAWDAKAKAKSVNIINGLFLKRRSDIKTAIQSVAYVPKLPELINVHTLHARETRSLTLEQTIHLLCKTFRHNSTHVRVMGLKQLMTICRDVDKKQQLYMQASSATIGISKHGLDTMINLLLQELLYMVRKERDQSVIDVIASALGELGAIDPARVQVSLPSTVQSRGTSNTNPNPSALFAKFQDGKTGMPAPWDCSPVDMGLLLLERFLVPGMKATGSASEQDKTGFAIQQILRKLADLGDPGYDKSHGLPESIQNILSKRSMLDIVEPFWSTSYRIEGKPRERKIPIYHPGIEFNQWLAFWTRHLLMQCKENAMTEIFEACGGLLRSRGELCQFILPQIIALYLDTHSDENILLEICHVLSEAGENKGHTSIDSLVPALESLSHSSGLVNRTDLLNLHMTGTDSISHMSVQAVFTLLDTLASWASSGRSLEKSGKSAPAHTISKASSLTKLMIKLVERVPKLLLCLASLRIRAHTRALRYFELHSRDLATVKKQKEFASGSMMHSTSSSVENSDASCVISRPTDGSNYELPVLIPSQLDLLMGIFSKLEDPDALQGVQALRQINGYQNMPWVRILELEQTDDWLGALLEYGLLQDTSDTSGDKGMVSKTSKAGFSSVANSVEKMKSETNMAQSRVTPKSSNSRNSASTSSKRKRANSDTVAGVLPNMDDNMEASTDDDETVIDLTADNHQYKDSATATGVDLRNFCLIEKGRLRCLIELEQLDSVVDQTLGMVQRLPDLEQDLLPLGVEATWRLQQWDNLEAFLSREGTSHSHLSSGHLTRQAGVVSDLDDSFPVSVGRILLDLHKCDRPSFEEHLMETRRQAMSSLSAASMESYGRAYPQLVRLHILSEVEAAYDLIHAVSSGSSEVGEEKKLNIVKSWDWERRLEMTSQSARQRSLLLAVRRTILGAAGLKGEVARNWLGLSDTMRQLGHFDAARVALRSAEQQSGQTSTETLLQECRILKDSGKIHEALNLIEPVEHNVLAIRQLHREHRKSGKALPGTLSTEDRIITFSERLYLATQLMVESKVKQGSAIIDRYKCIIEIRPKWPKAHFELAKYYEYLYHTSKAKETADNDAVTLGNTMSPRSGSSVGSARTSGSRGIGDDYEFKSHNWLLMAVVSYIKAISWSQNDSDLQYQGIIIQALPRMLTLFLSFTQLRERDLGPAAQRVCAYVVFSTSLSRNRPSVPTGSGNYRAIDSLRRAQTECCETVKANTGKITPAVWFSCLPQLVSRVEHINRDTVDTIIHIILKVLSAHPKQSVWHVAGLLQSLIPTRQEIGDDLVRKATANLGAAGAEEAAMLSDAKLFFRNLIELAVAPAQKKEKKLKWKWPQNLTYTRFIVPMQGVLTAIPRSAVMDNRNEYTSSSLSGVTEKEMYMKAFDEWVDVASSKAKPKTVYLQTTDGKTIKFLAKQEKNGDLRKDSRMMEFNTVVNRLFQDDSETRRRNLKLRTYAVVCLNEECGILEWVNSTSCVRHLIQESHSYQPLQYPQVPMREVMESFPAIQTTYGDNMEELVKAYRQLVMDKYRPCFHLWFLEAFPDPTAWFGARTTFTRSMAAWSVVGYLIGLGDRHTENVLLDTTTGECVHVDFDCIFSKGLTLTRPEIVPFRLTPNLVDAMGVTGVEGTFRRTMEVSFTVLKENKETLIAVLEPFLRDPTVAWSRGGRAQRVEHINATGSTMRGAAHTSTVVENADAIEALDKISSRLAGVYNLSNPSKNRIMRAYRKRIAPQPRFGLGAVDDESLPLSVRGQVQRLIDEARAEENLAQMYIGWQPWA